MEINEVYEKVKEIKEKYRYQKDIYYFIELNNPKTTEQIMHTQTHPTIEQALNDINNSHLFIDTCQYDLWLMYYVENGDIGFLANIDLNMVTKLYECESLEC